MKKVVTLMILLTLLVTFTTPIFATEKRSITTKDTEWFVDGIETLEEAMKIAEKRMGKLTVPVTYNRVNEEGIPYVEETTKEVDNVVFIEKRGGDYTVTDVGAYTLMMNSTGFEYEVEQRLHRFAYNMTLSYPDEELVYINNNLWQNTEYKDYYVSEVKRLISEGAGSGFSMLRNNDPNAWKIFLDARYNGKARVILKPETEEEKAYSKKVLYGSIQENVVEEVITEDTVNEDNNQSVVETEKSIKAVMELGDNKVVIIENGVIKKTNKLTVNLKAIKGVTMIPLRGILDELGVALSYDGRNVIISYEGKGIILKNGSNVAIVNGANIKMPASMIIENGRTLIPLRAVSELLGFKVSFDSVTNEVIVEKILEN